MRAGAGARNRVDNMLTDDTAEEPLSGSALSQEDRNRIEETRGGDDLWAVMRTAGAVKQVAARREGGGRRCRRRCRVASVSGFVASGRGGGMVTRQVVQSAVLVKCVGARLI